MCNVTCKIIISSIFLCLMSCANNHDNAQNLYNEAASAIDKKNYDKALCLIDSINTSYPEQTQVRRNALHLQAKATEGKTLRDIESNDSLITVLQAQYNQMEPLFIKINSPQLVEPYFVAKNSDKSILEKTGIQARISTDGEFYLISSLQGQIKHTSVSLVANGNIATTSIVAYDGDRNYRSSNSEMITFIESECDTLGQFAVKNSGSAFTLRFNGVRNKSIKLRRNDSEALALTYRYSVVISELKKAIRRKEMLDQKLLLARDQMARTINDNIIDEVE